MNTPALISLIHKDESAGRSLVEFLRSAGLRSMLSHSVDEFISRADAEQVKIIVIDEQLIGDDHDSLIAFCKNVSSTPLPFILLSTDSDPVMRRRAREIGAATFFREPVDGEALLDAILWELEDWKSSV